MSSPKDQTPCDNINKMSDQASRLRDLARKGQPSESENRQKIEQDLTEQLEKLSKTVANVTDELMKKYAELQQQLKNASKTDDLSKQATKIDEIQDTLLKNKDAIKDKEFNDLRKQFENLKKSVKSEADTKQIVKTAGKKVLKKMGLDIPSLLRSASGNSVLVERIIAASEVIGKINKQRREASEESASIPGAQKTREKEGVVPPQSTKNTTNSEIPGYARIPKIGADAIAGGSEISLDSSGFQRLYDLNYEMWGTLLSMDERLGIGNTNLDKVLDYIMRDAASKNATQFDPLETAAEASKKAEDSDKVDAKNLKNLFNANSSKSILGSFAGDFTSEFLSTTLGTSVGSILPKMLGAASISALVPVLVPIIAGAATVWLGRAAIKKILDLDSFDGAQKSQDAGREQMNRANQLRQQQQVASDQMKQNNAALANPAISDETKKDISAQNARLEDSRKKAQIEELQSRIRALVKESIKDEETATSQEVGWGGFSLFGNSAESETAKQRIAMNNTAIQTLSKKLEELGGAVPKDVLAQPKTPEGYGVSTPTTQTQSQPTAVPTATPVPVPTPTATPSSSNVPVRTREPSGVPSPMPAPSPTATQQAAAQELVNQGITDPTAISNIMAQLQAESNFKPRSEEIDRYSAKTLLKLYGPGSGNKVRFNTLEDAQAAVDKGPEHVGNLIYGGRMGNASDEGYKYRGRGIVQLTGKDNYAHYGKKIGLGDELVKNPDLANDPQIAAKLAAAFYADKKIDYTDINQVSRATGHAGGGKENARRAEYAQAFKAKLPSMLDQKPEVLANRNQDGDKLQMASLQNASLKMDKSQAPIIVQQNINSSGGGNNNGNGRSDPTVESPRLGDSVYQSLVANTLSSTNS
jgi:putative chitinase